MPDSFHDRLMLLRQSPLAPGDPTTQPPAPPTAGAGPRESSTIESLIDSLSEIGTGVGQGMGERAVSLGNLVHRTPVAGNITDALARLFGGDPEATFDKKPKDVAAAFSGYTGKPLEETGRMGEEIAEFFVPGSKLTKLAGNKAVMATPDALINASPKVGRLVSHLLSIIGQTGAEAGQAGAISALQGADRPEEAAAIAGTAPVTAETLAAVAPILRSDLLKRGISLAGGAGAASQIGGTLGIGAGMGIYGQVRQVLNKLLSNPKIVSGTRRIARRGLPVAGRIGSALDTEMQRSEE